MCNYKVWNLTVYVVNCKYIASISIKNAYACTCTVDKACTRISTLRREVVVNVISIFFWMRLIQARLCRSRFKNIFDDTIILLSGKIIEYICLWRFNSINMTWNKWLVFTKLVMGLKNISQRPCPIGVVCLPCVLYDSIQHLCSVCGPVVWWYDSRFAWRTSLVRDAHKTL